MSTKPKTLHHLPSVDSTNNYAMALIDKRLADDEMLVTADEQINGKGRQGNKWHSNKGENILLSLVLKMNWLPLKRQFNLSAAIAVGTCKFLQQYVENVFIKWPNDIYINDSKAAGILIENKIKGTLWQWAVAGVGCNINQVDLYVPGKNTISLKQITGKRYDTHLLSNDLWSFLIMKVHSLKNDGPEKIISFYNQHLYAKDEQVILKKGSEEFEARIQGVSPAGKLIIRSEMEEEFSFDEVKFIRKA